MGDIAELKGQLAEQVAALESVQALANQSPGDEEILQVLRDSLAGVSFPRVTNFSGVYSQGQTLWLVARCKTFEWAFRSYSTACFVWHPRLFPRIALTSSSMCGLKLSLLCTDADRAASSSRRVESSDKILRRHRSNYICLQPDRAGVCL